MSCKLKGCIFWAGVIGAVIGVIAVLAAEKADELTSTAEFCGTSCHSMQAYVATEQTYVESAHQTAYSGVHATCSDCHISSGIVAASWDHISAGIKDIISEMTHDFEKPEEWEKLRTQLAYNVRDMFLRTDSANCRKCHDETKIQPGFTRGKEEHELALKNSITCIACHYNLVHKPVKPREEFLRRAGVSPQ
jgi:nitrate/TMAO reductase-like tetraheme cytochrome c subunit